MLVSTRLVMGVSLGFLSLFASSRSYGQIVQLPSFSRFSYSGSVLVPDRGSTSLGGISRSASQAVRGNGRRGSAFSGGHSGASVQVTIIDHDAIDRQLRGLPPKDIAPSRKLHRRTPNANPTDRGFKPVDPDAEGKALVRFARKQFREGNHRLAREAYRIAFERLSPALSDLAKREYKRVFREQVAARP
jgi:hypothetical protein